MSIDLVQKLTPQQEMSFEKEDASVFFDEDLRIVAVFDHSGVRRCLIPENRSLWLVSVRKKTKEATFFEHVFGSKKTGHTYKQSHAHPNMINREPFKKAAVQAFNTLINKRNPHDTNHRSFET